MLINLSKNYVKKVKHFAELDKKALNDLKRENLGLNEANEKINELNATKQIQYIEIL